MSSAEAVDEPVPPDESEPSMDLPPVADPADAEWRLRRLRRVRRQIAEVKATYDDLVASTQEWYDTESGALIAEAEEIERQLAGWLAARIHLDPRGPKSVSLPTAKISSSKGGLSVDVSDEEAFMEWARKNNVDLIAFPEPPPPPPPRPNKAEIKAAALNPTDEPGQYPVVVNAEGETIPGVALVRAERAVKIDYRES